MPPESKKYNKVISLSGDFGMDQYVSWCLPAAEVNFDTIWPKYENFGSHKQMKCELGVTCLQTFSRAIDQWMSGIMLYKLHLVLLNIHQKLQISCIMTSFGFSSKMKNLCLRPSMMAALTLTSSLQSRSGSMQRRWRHQKQLHSTSSRLQVIPKQFKSI